ncbi:MAG: GGDEF domain-containing protein [Eubacteriales bacterium]|nr:GGDEF domain-containing protein [Eubacteriales bacterium]
MVRKEFFSIIFFAIPPVIGIILQIMFYGTSLILSGVVLSLLIIFFNIQTHGMHTDYLTGVSNRKMLDAYLKEKINQCNEQNIFAAILLDINDFKHINDTYGHSVGDNALENAAELLRQSLRIGDFVARFGGDEFCIITDISEDMDLDITVHRIYKNLNKFNASNSHPYKLSFSMGYAAYDYHLQMSAEEFLKQIDALMYEDKSIHKRNFCFSKNRR